MGSGVKERPRSGAQPPWLVVGLQASCVGEPPAHPYSGSGTTPVPLHRLPRSPAHSDPHGSLCLLLPWPGSASALIPRSCSGSPPPNPSCTGTNTHTASQSAALGTRNALRHKKALPLSRSNTSGLLVYISPKFLQDGAPLALHTPTFQSD